MSLATPPRGGRANARCTRRVMKCDRPVRYLNHFFIPVNAESAILIQIALTRQPTV